jgi:glyoxylase-like metal-dependent hydrolase (beta-lactamase superfamily II)
MGFLRKKCFLFLVVVAVVFSVFYVKNVKSQQLSEFTFDNFEILKGYAFDMLEKGREKQTASLFDLIPYNFKQKFLLKAKDGVLSEISETSKSLTFTIDAPVDISYNLVLHLKDNKQSDNVKITVNQQDVKVQKELLASVDFKKGVNTIVIQTTNKLNVDYIELIMKTPGKSLVDTIKEKKLVDYDGFIIGELQKDVYNIEVNVPWDASSMYILVDKKEALVIDGGWAQSGSRLNSLSFLINNIIDGRKVSIALTHGHLDHVGNFTNKIIPIKQVKAVYCPKMDYVNDILNGVVAKNALNYYKRKVVLCGEYTNVPEITVGKYKFELMDVPAHTKGSLVMIDYNDEIIFTGDAFGNVFGLMILESRDRDLLGTIETGANRLIPIMEGMKNPKLYSGHYNKTTVDGYGGDLDVFYLYDVLTVLHAIKDGTARNDAILLYSVEGAKFSIAVLPTKVAIYRESN